MATATGVLDPPARPRSSPRRGLAAAAPARGGVGPRPAARARQRPRRELRRRRRRVAGDAHPARRVVVVPVGRGLPGVARRGAGRRGVRGHRAVGADAHGRAADRVPGPRRPDLRRAPPRRRAGRRGRRVPAAGVRATVDQRRRALRPAAVGHHHHRARRVARVASVRAPGPAVAGGKRVRGRVRGLPRPLHAADDARRRRVRAVVRAHRDVGRAARSAAACARRRRPPARARPQASP